MNSKKAFKLMLISSLLALDSFAQESENSSALEKGYHFGDLKVEENEKLPKKEDVGQILLELLKQSKKQTKYQEEIRDILAAEFDPKPKKIVVNGKECIENSTGDCFKMPMINEVKKVPAIANALQKRDLESVKVQEMWYGKYIVEVLKLGYLKALAIRELGPKYPLSTAPIGTVDVNGWDSTIMKVHRKSIFEKHAKNFEFNIFIGLNHGLDMYSLVPLAYTVRDNPNIKFNLVFISKEKKEQWEKQYKNFYASKFLKQLKTYVQPLAFKEFKVYTTPSLYLKDKKNNKDTILHVGKLVELDMINKTIEYMIQNNFIKRNELNSINAWGTEKSGEFIENYYRNKVGIKYEK